VWGCSSAGEHFVDIEGVTGSIPVTPTISSKIILKQRVSFGVFLLSGLCVVISSLAEKGQKYGYQNDAIHWNFSITSIRNFQTVKMAYPFAKASAIS
jgi:hypothetical protein